MCVCVAGSPISGSFSTLLPSAFLVLVELRPTPPQSNTAKNLCTCQGSGVGSSCSLWGSIVFTVVWGLAYLLTVVENKEAVSWVSQSSGRHCWVLFWAKVRLQARSLCYLGRLLPSQSSVVQPQTLFTLVGRSSSGRGITGLVKGTEATGAKVGTFEARCGSPAASEAWVRESCYSSHCQRECGGRDPASLLSN